MNDHKNRWLALAALALMLTDMTQLEAMRRRRPKSVEQTSPQHQVHLIERSIEEQKTAIRERENKINKKLRALRIKNSGPMETQSHLQEIARLGDLGVIGAPKGFFSTRDPKARRLGKLERLLNLKFEHEGKTRKAEATLQKLNEHLTIAKRAADAATLRKMQQLRGYSR